MNDFFNGEKLYGNDFSIEEIKKWYEEEGEGYANLGSKNKETYSYAYHVLNKVHGFNKIKGVTSFERVLGFGSAYGYEFAPILDRIKKITIIEPSNELVSNKIGDILPVYVKPSIDGKLTFEDNSFDLITCFGTLHHIPNVADVLGEIIRVLKPNGYLLIREPIQSMGDWREPRNGLTKNERGIPIPFFNSELKKYPVKIVSANPCLTATSFIQRTFNKFLKKPIYSYKSYVLADKILSNLLRNNILYHPKTKINRISPTSIFYVIQKEEYFKSEFFWGSLDMS